MKNLLFHPSQTLLVLGSLSTVAECTLHIDGGNIDGTQRIVSRCSPLRWTGRYDRLHKLSRSSRQVLLPLLVLQGWRIWCMLFPLVSQQLAEMLTHLACCRRIWSLGLPCSGLPVVVSGSYAMLPGSGDKSNLGVPLDDRIQHWWHVVSRLRGLILLWWRWGWDLVHRTCQWWPGKVPGNLLLLSSEGDSRWKWCVWCWRLFWNFKKRLNGVLFFSIFKDLWIYGNLNHNYEVYLFSKYAKARAQSFSVFALSIFTNGSKGSHKCAYALISDIWLVGWTRQQLTWIILRLYRHYRWMRAWTLLMVKMRRLLAGSADQSNVSCNIQDVASCYRFSCYYRFSDIAINSVNPPFIWWLEFSKNG